MQLATLTLCFALACCARPLRTPRAPDPARPSLRVMSYNVNFGLAGDLATVAAIRGGAADLIFLQETTPGWERALRAAFAASHPHMAFRHSGGAGGLAVLSRYPLRTRAYMASPCGWFPAWRVELATPLGPLQVLQVHLRPPVSDSGSVVSGYFTTGSFRVKEITHFAAGLKPGVPTLVLGDFNEDHDGDAVGLLIRGQRFGSALREFQPGATTWRWDTRFGRLTHTLDHVLYSSQLEPLDARVLPTGRSDHLPLVATFQISAIRPASPAQIKGRSSSLSL